MKDIFIELYAKNKDDITTWLILLGFITFIAGLLWLIYFMTGGEFGG